LCEPTAGEEVENRENKCRRGCSNRGDHGYHVPLKPSADDEAVWHVQKTNEASENAGDKDMLGTKSPAATAEACKCCKRESKSQKGNAEPTQDRFGYP
jgi:hypothetical protein